MERYQSTPEQKKVKAILHLFTTQKPSIDATNANRIANALVYPSKNSHEAERFLNMFPDLKQDLQSILNGSSAPLKENTMKLTKSLIKKLVMESLEESPVGGSPEVVNSMTTTNPMDNHGENGTFEELSDGTYRLIGKDGNVVELSPEEMEKLVAHYKESEVPEGGHEETEPKAPVQEMGADHLREGRITKSGLQKIIKEEYKKLTEGYGGYAGSSAKMHGRRSVSRYGEPTGDDPSISGDTFAGRPRDLPTDTGNVELDALGYQSINFPGLNADLRQASEYVKNGTPLAELPDGLKNKLTHHFLFKTFLPHAQKMAKK